MITPEIIEQITKIWYISQPILEVGILTVLFYYILYFLRGTRAYYILAGITIFLLLITTIAEFLKFEVISRLLENLWTALTIALIVIFQPELRRLFAYLGSTQLTNRKIKKQVAINEVVNAVIQMSKRKIGALIVFERQIGMQSLINNAVPLSCKLNNMLLETIFFPNSPLHDGALIVRGDRIVAAHAILPLSQSSIVASKGTRHRAGVGITEETDAVTIIVSEETGEISLTYNGRIKFDIQPDKLSRLLRGLLVMDNKQNHNDIEDVERPENLFDTISIRPN